MAHPYFAVGRPMLFGHRGASGECPENTLPAFERALAQGAMAIETDVRLTRDGEVVVFHDADLARTTDARGPIAERSLDELKQLDAGYHFSPEGDARHPFRGQRVRIPTLDEAFQAFPDVPFNIELKAGEPELIEATLDLIAARSDRTLVAAAEDDIMAALRVALGKRSCQPAMGASVGDVLGFVRAALGDGEAPPEPMALQIPPNFGGQPLVTPELLAFAQGRGVHVHVWTVNDPVEMRRLLELGVDGVMSDFPARLIQVAGATG